MQHIQDVLGRTDWALLAEQKLALCKAVCTDNETLLDGLLNWLDALQDAAAQEGMPVVWLTEDERV
jgi:hypothetical protein